MCKKADFKDAIGLIPEVLEAIETIPVGGYAFEGGMFHWKYEPNDENTPESDSIAFKISTFVPFQDKVTEFSATMERGDMLVALVQGVYEHAKGLKHA